MPTAKTDEDFPDLVEEPTGTFTHYLVVHNDGPSLVGVVDMLDQWVGDSGTIQAVYLITPDGRATPVNVNDVNHNIEFEICLGAEHTSEALAEYVCFESEDSTDVVDRQVYVNGYKAEPES
jgi:hypothetical protein